MNRRGIGDGKVKKLTILISLLSISLFPYFLFLKRYNSDYQKFFHYIKGPGSTS